MAANTRFQLLQQHSKRSAGIDVVDRACKMPRADDIAVEKTPPPLQKPLKLPLNAPLDVCLYKYTDNASDLWEMLKGHDRTPLYQIQVLHGVSM